MPTPITDRLARILNGDAHASAPRVRPHGGEWDAWFALSRRQRRILIGARYARATGRQPDVLAAIIRAHGGATDERDALAWFYQEALAAVVERRRAAHWTRHAKVARRHGHVTYFAYRQALARAEGHASYRERRRMRQAA